jgi:Tfp pilus assembly protein PilP
MKLTKLMKLNTKTGILVVGMMAGGAWAQNPNIINNVQGTMQGVQAQKTADSNAALSGPSAQSSRPSAGTAGKPQLAGPAQTTAVPMHTAAKRPLPPAGPRPVIAAKDPFDKKVAVKAEVAKTAVAKNAAGSQPSKPEEKKWAMSGKRDPFFSPVVQQSTGSGCSTGKKCLEIGQIDVRGVVKSETGFIAVVTNGLNKAYFLRENDPVFNGYVIKITGDTVVFQETVQDKLGKPLIREVTKKIVTPAV